MAGTDKVRAPERSSAAWALFGCFCLLAACLVMDGCGKKGDPTLKSYEKPPVPAGLSAIHRESEIILLWQYPKGREQFIKGFHLLKSCGGDFERFAFVGNAARTFTDKDFQTGSACRYKIVSESLKGATSGDPVVLALKPESPPAPPQDVSFRIEYDTLTLHWKSSGEGVLYNVYKSNIPGKYLLTPVNEEPLRTASFVDSFSRLKPAYYTVRGLLGGESRDEGPPSQEIVVDVSGLAPDVPGNLQAVATKEHVTLVWTEPLQTWVTGYNIYRETRSDEGYKLIGTSQTPAFLDKDSPTTKRNYRVTAVGPSQEGPPAVIKDVIFRK